jgi:hypothetical protein
METALLEFMFIQRLLMDLNHVHVNCVHLLSLLSTALIIAQIVGKSFLRTMSVNVAGAFQASIQTLLLLPMDLVIVLFTQGSTIPRM